MSEDRRLISPAEKGEWIWKTVSDLLARIRPQIFLILLSLTVITLAALYLLFRIDDSSTPKIVAAAAAITGSIQGIVMLGPKLLEAE